MKYVYRISYIAKKKEKASFSSVRRILDHRIQTMEDIQSLIRDISEENGIDRSKGNLIILETMLLKELKKDNE